MSGSVLLFLGGWLSAHKDSFMAITKLGLENRHIQVRKRDLSFCSDAFVFLLVEFATSAVFVLRFHREMSDAKPANFSHYQQSCPKLVNLDL